MSSLFNVEFIRTTDDVVTMESDISENICEHDLLRVSRALIELGVKIQHQVYDEAVIYCDGDEEAE